MKKIILSLMILSMLTACAGAVAEAPRNGGRGNGSGGGSMQTLNEGIAYMSGDGVDQDYEKALELFMEAFEAGNAGKHQRKRHHAGKKLFHGIHPPYFVCWNSQSRTASSLYA